MADRIGVIHKGELMLVEDKAELMRKLGKKQLTLELQRAARRGAAERSTASNLDARQGRRLARLHLRRAGGAHRHLGAPRRAERPGIRFRDLQTHESSLEDIFVSLW